MELQKGTLTVFLPFLATRKPKSKLELIDEIVTFSSKSKNEKVQKHETMHE